MILYIVRRSISREENVLSCTFSLPIQGKVPTPNPVQTFTSILIDLVHIHNPLSYMPEVRRISVIHWSEIQHTAKTIQHTSFRILPDHTFQTRTDRNSTTKITTFHGTCRNEKMKKSNKTYSPIDGVGGSGDEKLCTRKAPESMLPALADWLWCTSQSPGS